MSQEKRLFIATQGFRPYDATPGGAEVIGPVEDFLATLRAADVLLSWRFLADVTTWTLTRSADGGKTFTTIATIPNDKTDLAWDASLQRFTYADAAGGLGYVYMLRYTDGIRNGVPVLATPAPEPGTVTIFGYILSLHGGEKIETDDRRVHFELIDQDALSVSAMNLLSVTPEISNTKFDVWANDDGVWYANLLPGMLVRVSSTKGTRTVRVPTDTTIAHVYADLTDESGYGKLL